MIRSRLNLIFNTLPKSDDNHEGIRKGNLSAIRGLTQCHALGSPCVHYDPFTPCEYELVGLGEPCRMYQEKACDVRVQLTKLKSGEYRASFEKLPDWCEEQKSDEVPIGRGGLYAEYVKRGLL
jgi:hypothetical protein